MKDPNKPIPREFQAAAPDEWRVRYAAAKANYVGFRRARPAPQIVEKTVYVTDETELDRVRRERDEALARLNSAAQKTEELQDVVAQPPEEIRDLFNPDLTARQNYDDLVQRYAAKMNEREYALSHGERSKAARLLEEAERIQSAVNWSRPRFAGFI